MIVHVIMSNDYPLEVYEDEGDALDAKDRLDREEKRQRALAENTHTLRGYIYYSVRAVEFRKRLDMPF